MELSNASFSLLVNNDHVTLEVRDNASCVTFLRAKFTPEQFCRMLSRESRVEGNVTVHGLDIIGLKHECKKHEFALPEGLSRYNRDADLIHSEAIKTTPEGWIPDNYYGSQDSFFTRGNKDYARVTIRRWVKI